MFDLVDDVEHYPEFLPWCGGSAGARDARRTARRRASTSTITASRRISPPTTSTAPPESIVITLQRRPVPPPARRMALPGARRRRVQGRVRARLRVHDARARNGRRTGVQPHRATRSSTRSSAAPKPCIRAAHERVTADAAVTVAYAAPGVEALGRARRCRPARRWRDAVARVGLVARLGARPGALELRDLRPARAARRRRSRTATGSRLTRPLVADPKEPRARARRAAKTRWPRTPSKRQASQSGRNAPPDADASMRSGRNSDTIPRDACHVSPAVRRLAALSLRSRWPHAAAARRPAHRRDVVRRVRAKAAPPPRSGTARRTSRSTRWASSASTTGSAARRPRRGLDCSGLVRYVFQQVTGVTLPRTAKEMSRLGDKVAQRRPAARRPRVLQHAPLRRSRTSASISATTASSTRRRRGSEVEIAAARPRPTGRSTSTARGVWSACCRRSCRRDLARGRGAPRTPAPTPSRGAAARRRRRGDLTGRRCAPVAALSPSRRRGAARSPSPARCRAAPTRAPSRRSGCVWLTSAPLAMSSVTVDPLPSRTAIISADVPLGDDRVDVGAFARAGSRRSRRGRRWPRR